MCSRTGAFEELITPGVEGHLVPTGDAAALAQAATLLMADVPATQAMGVRARQTVATRFSLQTEADGIGQVYRRLWGKG